MRPQRYGSPINAHVSRHTGHMISNYMQRKINDII